MRSGTIVIAGLLLLSTPALAETVGPDVEADIPQAVYAVRRAKLSKKLGDCVAAIKAFPRKGGSGNEFDDYFYYLTGVKDDGSMLLLAPREKIYKQTLLFTPRDAEVEIWEGYREAMSPKLRKKYRVDSVGRIRGSVPRGLKRAFRHSQCYAQLRAAYADKDAIPSSALDKFLKAFGVSTRQKWQELERMRSIHDDEEILRMDKAIAITFEGHRAAVRRMQDGVAERKVAADIEKAYYDSGATGLAFPSIVATGKNGAILHWRAADTKMEADDLVVVDIGASFGGYAADITRTWPVSGKFSPEQRKIYEIVLKVQQQVIDAVKPGISLDELNVMAQEALLDQGYEMPHGIGHFVGLNVHDVGDRSAPLEPGIYLKGEFGVRIEDMVLITERGHRHMSADLPRSVEDIEKYMREQRK